MHVALIPDGNRRFMRKRGIRNLLSSYEMGIKRFYDFLEWCIDFDVGEVTIYALSTENITNRSEREISTLFKVFSDQADKALDDGRLHDRKVHINVCGDKDFLTSGIKSPSLARRLLDSLTRLEDETRRYSDVTLNLALAYGGRQEILNAAKKTVDAGLPLTEENVQSNLWVKDYPDIVIRTAEERLSNFLLWQSAYSEIYFPDKLWQEFERDDLAQIISDYRGRERRYGQ